MFLERKMTFSHDFILLNMHFFLNFKSRTYPSQLINEMILSRLYLYLISSLGMFLPSAVNLFKK